MAVNKYKVGKLWFFPQLGRKAVVGEVIELEADVAERYVHNEPGLLTPVRVTAQAEVPVARDAAPKRRRSRAQS